MKTNQEYKDLQLSYERALKTANDRIAELERGTCKWERLTAKEGGGWIAECDTENGIPFSNLLMNYFSYCPFCGAKIERI